MLGLIPTCDCFACSFKREDKNERGGPTKNICLIFSPCNTGNPKQNYQVRTLRTNYRHEIHMTLQLVAGVIFAPHTLSYFNSMSAYFAVRVMEGCRFFPCLYGKLQPDRTVAFLCLLSVEFRLFSSYSVIFGSAFV